MFNVGQILHNITNDCPVIFGGIQLGTKLREIYDRHDSKTNHIYADYIDGFFDGDEQPFTRFITEDGLIADHIEVPFKYEPYRLDNEIYLGTLVTDLDLLGHYFGIIARSVELECADEIRKAFDDVRKHICHRIDCIDCGRFLPLNHVHAFDHTHRCEHVGVGTCSLSGINCDGHTCKYDTKTVLEMKARRDRYLEFDTDWMGSEKKMSCRQHR